MMTENEVKDALVKNSSLEKTDYHSLPLKEFLAVVFRETLIFNKVDHYPEVQGENFQPWVEKIYQRYQDFGYENLHNWFDVESILMEYVCSVGPEE